MKRARDDLVNRFIDLEATVGEDEDEDEDEDNDEDNDGVFAGVSYSSINKLTILLGGFIDKEPAINPRYTPLRQMDETSDRAGSWHDLVASLDERYATRKTTLHIAEDNCRNDRTLDPVIVSSVGNIITHDYPFWRVRCRVSY